MKEKTLKICVCETFSINVNKKKFIAIKKQKFIIFVVIFNVFKKLFLNVQNYSRPPTNVVYNFSLTFKPLNF